MNNRTSWIPVAVLLAACVFASCDPQSSSDLNRVCFPKGCVEVEIARTRAERAKGLQGRTFLGSDQGMLFVFTESDRYGFWMKNTLIPLDIIWIDHNKRIASIMRNVEPCKTEKCPVYEPDRPGMYVLELNAGASYELGLEVGEQMTF